MSHPQLYVFFQLKVSKQTALPNFKVDNEPNCIHIVLWISVVSEHTCTVLTHK